METGKYKTPDGQTLNVVEVDVPNKSVRVDLGSGQSKWYSEPEYSTWIKEGVQEEQAPEVTIEEPEVAEIVEPIEEELIYEEKTDPVEPVQDELFDDEEFDPVFEKPAKKKTKSKKPAPKKAAAKKPTKKKGK